MAILKRRSVPRQASWKNFADVHPSTLQLFGCYLVRRRLQRKLSQDGLAAEASRSTDWVVAVERGELLPTTTSLLLLNKSLSPNHGPHLPEVLSELDQLPYGRRAQSLREEYGLPSPPSAYIEHIDGDSAIPVAHELEFEQRLLTVTPVLLALAILGLLLSFGVLKEQSVSWTGPETARSLGLAIAAASTAGALSQPISAVWSRLVWPLRLLGNLGNYRLIWAVRRSEKITKPKGLAWTAPTELPHLTPHFRSRVRAYSLGAEMSERLATIALGSAVLTWFAWRRAVSSDVADVEPNGWKWLFIASLASAGLFHFRSFVATRKLATALWLGFGRQDLNDGVRIDGD